MGEAAAKEPSMEDILSSIRKIISEENPPEEGAASAQSNPTSPGTSPAQGAAQSNLTHQQTTEEIISSPVESPKADPGEENSSLKQLADDAKALQASAPLEQTAGSDLMPQRESITDSQGSGSSLADIAASVTSPLPTDQGADDATLNVETKPDLDPSGAEPSIDRAGMLTGADTHPSVELQENSVEPASSAPLRSYQSTTEEEAAFKGALVSPSTDSAVNESFERLKRSAMDDIEAKTEVILRPMLREWLDNNLPSLVERLVREEIERVSRGI